MISADNTVAVVLAGGLSRRMLGRKKSEITLGLEPLLLRVIHRVLPQVSRVLVNLNEPVNGVDLSDFQVVGDAVSGFQGPLSGLVGAFDYLSKHDPACSALLLIPCDGPFLPPDLAERLIDALNETNADVACVRYAGALQPTFSLWRCKVGREAREMLVEKGQGGFKGVLTQLNTIYVDWQEAEPNPFFNINTPEDLQLAERLLEST